MHKVRVGLIGHGRQGRHYARILLDKRSGFELLALSRRDSAKGFKFEQDHGATFYNDYQILLTEKNLQAVVIVSPSSLHAKMAAAALERGLVVLLEKPLALSLEDHKIYAATLKRWQDRLMVAHTYRYEAVTRALRRELPKLGTPLEVHIVHNSTDRLSSLHPLNGALLSTGIHFFDILQDVGLARLQDLELTKGSIDPNKPEAWFTVAWRSLSIHGTLEVRLGAAEKSEEFIVHGSLGNLTLKRFAETGQSVYRNGTIRNMLVPRHHTLPLLMEDFRKLSLGQQATSVPYQDALDALNWVDAIGNYLRVK